MVTGEVVLEAPTIFEDQPLRVFALVGGIGTLLMAVVAGMANFGAIERLVIRDDATGDAPLDRLVRVEKATTEDELGGTGPPNHPRQQIR